MGEEIRKTGIDIIGDVRWGTHFCQFYQTKEDLIDVLVPYFKAGLENNEFCMWVTSEPLNEKEAKEAIRKAVPDFDRYVERGQIEVIPYTEWYTKSGKFDADEVLQGWVKKEKQALKRGFDGLRLTGNTFWLERKDWKDFSDYEEEVNNVIGKYRMLAICTYSLDRCGASELVDVVSNHQFALISREGKWELIESSERRRAEQALRESELKYRSLFESMLNSFAYCKILVDENNQPIDYVHLEVNDAWERAVGLKREDVIGKKITEVIPGIKESKTDLISIYGKVALTGEATRFELYFEPLEKWFTISVYSPRKGYFVAVFENITEHKRAEEALRESEQNFRHSLDSSPLGIRIINAKGETIYANQAILGIYGYSSIQEFKSIPAVERHTLKSYAERQERVRKREAGEPVPDRFEQSIIRKDGEVRNLEVFHREVLWGGEKQFQLIYLDITESKRAEEREKQLQKEFSLASRLASVGGLAAGVAHEINNPLTGVLAFSERLLRKSTDEKVSRDLKRIYDEAKRAAKVVERLLTFARRREPKKENSDVNYILRRALELRAYELKTSNIKVELDLAAGLPKVMVDSHQFQEVFLSIIMNAEQAMTEAVHGGKLGIKTQQMKSYISISFTDDGPGISAEYLDRVFDPFFTTRGKGGGTGLGLSVCHGIVQRHDGRIYAKSKPGKGATFVVELPLTGEKVKEAKRG